MDREYFAVKQTEGKYVVVDEKPDIKKEDYQEYILSVALNCRVDIPVRAKDIHDALGKWKEKFRFMELSSKNLDVISYHPVNITDEEGELTDLV